MGGMGVLVVVVGGPQANPDLGLCAVLPHTYIHTSDSPQNIR